MWGFVSYSHRDGPWVLDRLVPVLKAAGVEVAVDVERFRVGGSVVGQMDAEQDGAEKSLLVLSAAYLASDYCRHELRRAVARDADFSKYLTIPVRREAGPLPAEVDGSIYAALVDETRGDPGGVLVGGGGGGLRCAAPGGVGGGGTGVGGG